MNPSPDIALEQVQRLIRGRQWRAARELCRQFNLKQPLSDAGWIAASQIALALGSADEALDAIQRALEIAPTNTWACIQRAHCLSKLGRRRDMLQAAAEAEASAADDAAAWDTIGTIRSHATDQTGALAAYSRAIAIEPANPLFYFNRASVRRFLGDIAGAEADYDTVVAKRAADFEAYFNRSELRVQTATSNHIAQLHSVLPASERNWYGEVQIRFALAKEYEDLGLYDDSFRQLHQGAALRRKHLQYDVRTDVATADWIINAFDLVAGDISNLSEPDASGSSTRPIFVVGLPRSGSTVVERILSSHSQAISGGELDCFASAVVAAAVRSNGGAPLPRKRLVAQSAKLDFHALGLDYLSRVRDVLGKDEIFVDKMPLNYLYCGLIHRALPQARIIHVTRHPMAVCYAMYKTLFKAGYPFSYDLSEIAQYYLSYRKLMQHWARTMPGVIHEISYEDLVADPERQTRMMLAFCGLEWEDACLQFHSNPTPVTTASAAQVRRPLYDSAVALWRHYEPQLSGLRESLTAAGVGI